MDAAQSACLVLHGKAAKREDVRAAVRAVRDDGFHVDVHVTWEGGDARDSLAGRRMKDSELSLPEVGTGP